MATIVAVLVLLPGMTSSVLPHSIQASGRVSVSGISSGADLAVQLQVAYADVFSGVGVFAGQGFHCAVQRFPLDPLQHPDPSVPYCDGCPPNTTLLYDHCKRDPSWTNNASLLANFAKEQADKGTISSLDQLAEAKIYLYRGTDDHTYNKGSVNTTANFFRHFVQEESIYFESKINSSHLLPGINPYLCWWEEWAGKDNCTYDGAGEALHWIYGKNAFPNGRFAGNSTDLLKYMVPFKQKKFFPKDGRDPFLADDGMIFIPPSCQDKNSSELATQKCKVHLFLHGCGVTFSYSVFSTYGGFNEWAYKNDMIVFYPKMSTRGNTKQLKSGCFDGYGQTGVDYDLRTSSQMTTIVNIVNHLVDNY
eukprot:m.72698 g.72698  ORF g.72698 m.72698 type:complete len:363 (-) comp12349_c0_seq3:197-1285(-)